MNSDGLRMRHHLCSQRSKFSDLKVTFQCLAREVALRYSKSSALALKSLIKIIRYTKG